MGQGIGAMGGGEEGSESQSRVEGGHYPVSSGLPSRSRSRRKRFPVNSESES